MKRTIIAAVAAAALGAPLSAGQVQGQRQLKIYGGCSKLIAAGTDFSSVCKGEMGAIVDPSGDTTYAFQMGDGGILNFHGMDASAIGNGSDFFEVRQVSLIDRTKNNKVDAANASGRCYYGDPYNGVAKVRCDAVAEGRTFTARFTTNGQPPIG